MIPWYEKAVFYHIYPLGLSGAPRENSGTETVNRLKDMEPWIDHMKKIGCTALYIGPLFDSVGHGYETTDYKLLDRRLGSNEDFQKYVEICHKAGIRVIVDGVFNHTGRDFFAFQDILEHREQSAYRDWYCNVNFGGNNEYNDGFSYDNWGGYNLLAKLNQKNPAVKDYLYGVIRYWVSEFDIDGVRLDAADVLDFDFMKGLRAVANKVKEDFWLMGEVIHGDYGRWVNQDMLHSVTNYELHKGIYSSHNDHNYFEIAHSVRRLENLCPLRKLYTFLDNHDVERIASKLKNKEMLPLVYMILYTTPGIPSIYYGSEFGIEGKKEKSSDYSLRPCLKLEDYKDFYETDELLRLIMKLGELKRDYAQLSEGSYKELLLTNRQYAYARLSDGHGVITALNNDDRDTEVVVPLPVKSEKGMDLLSGEEVLLEDGKWKLLLKKTSGAILYV